MARHREPVKTLPTIWEVGDELWAIFLQILTLLDPPAKRPGRPRADHYLGVIQLACGLLWYRRQHRLQLLR